MKVLVTGGLGYIGSHTCVELLNKGHEIVVLDNLDNAELSVKDRIEEITKKTFSFYLGDCQDESLLEKILADHKVDALIHFAGYKAVGESVREPLMYYENNLFSSISLLKAMIRHKISMIVFSSSATVYSPDNVSPFVETMPLHPINPYGKTKLMVEKIIEDTLTAQTWMTGVLLRYFNPIGAHSSGLIGESPVGIPNNLMPYICQVAEGRRDRLHIFGNDYHTLDGTGVRDYIHVVDLAKGHVSALEKLFKKPGCFTYNLGTGKGTSVLELVLAFEKANALTIPYQIDGRRPGDAATVFADVTKAKEELDWQSELTIEEACLSSWNFQKTIEMKKE